MTRSGLAALTLAVLAALGCATSKTATGTTDNAPTGEECEKLGFHIAGTEGPQTPGGEPATTIDTMAAALVQPCVFDATRPEYECAMAAKGGEAIYQCFDRAVRAFNDRDGSHPELADDECKKIIERTVEFDKTGPAAPSAEDRAAVQADCMKWGTKRLYACVIATHDTQTALRRCVPLGKFGP